MAVFAVNVYKIINEVINVTIDFTTRHSLFCDVNGIPHNSSYNKKIFILCTLKCQYQKRKSQALFRFCNVLHFINICVIMTDRIT